MSELKRLREDDTVAPELRDLVRGARRSRAMSDRERARHRRNVARIASGPIAATVWLWSSKIWATLLGVAALGLGVALLVIPTVRHRNATPPSAGTRTVASSPSTRRVQTPERAARVEAPRSIPVVRTPDAVAAPPPISAVMPLARPAEHATRRVATDMHARAGTAPASPGAGAVPSRTTVVRAVNPPALAPTSVSPTAATTSVASPIATVDPGAPTPTASSAAGAQTRLAGLGGAANTTPPDALAQETQAMVRAHGVLASQPGAALALVDEVLRQHPGTSLAPEGLYIAVHALRRLGRDEEARVRAQRIVSIAPRTPQARAVRRLFPDLE